MSLLTDMLVRLGYEVNEADLAEALGDLLPTKNQVTGSLTAADELYLAQYSGAAPSTSAESGTLAARRIALVTAEVAQSLSRAEVADLLSIAPSRVSHRAADGQLYAFRAGRAKMLFPDWQFGAGATLPYLAQVVSALEVGAPPALVRRFMLGPDVDLDVGGIAMSPAGWLSAGNKPEPVLRRAPTLGDQA